MSSYLRVTPIVLGLDEYTCRHVRLATMVGYWKTFHSCYITVIIVQFLHYCCEKFLAFMCPLYVVVTCIIFVWGTIKYIIKLCVGEIKGKSVL